MNVLVVDMEAPNAAELFSKSLKETGFAVLENHPLSIKQINHIYQEWETFFNQSESEKETLLFNTTTQDGFFPQRVSEVAKGCQQKDIKEFFQYYPWGQYPMALSNKTRDLYDDLNRLAITLLEWTEHFLPKEVANKLSMPLSKMIEDAHKTMLRILHYPPLVGNEPKGAIRAAAHGDINLLTLLVGATENGLQVQDSQQKWHDVPLDKNKISVNIGDMLEMCTDGYYRSTLHQVVNPSNNNHSRLSMPFFLHPRDDVRLSENYTADEFLEERLKELGVK
jgi:isopenicillin N synthase-like dioxygenase